MKNYYSKTIRIISIVTLLAFLLTQAVPGYALNQDSWKLRQVGPAHSNDTDGDAIGDAEQAVAEALGVPKDALKQIAGFRKAENKTDDMPAGRQSSGEISGGKINQPHAAPATGIRFFKDVINKALRILSYKFKRIKPGTGRKPGRFSKAEETYAAWLTKQLMQNGLGERSSLIAKALVRLKAESIKQLIRRRILTKKEAVALDRLNLNDAFDVSGFAKKIKAQIDILKSQGLSEKKIDKALIQNLIHWPAKEKRARPDLSKFIKPLKNFVIKDAPVIICLTAIISALYSINPALVYILPIAVSLFYKLKQNSSASQQRVSAYGLVSGIILLPVALASSFAHSIMPLKTASGLDVSVAVFEQWSKKYPGENTLWGIAKDFYGDGRLWKFLAELNGIDDPAKILPGSKIMVPQISDPDKLAEIIKLVSSADPLGAKNAIASLHSQPIWDFYASIQHGTTRGDAFVQLKQYTAVTPIEPAMPGATQPVPSVTEPQAPGVHEPFYQQPWFLHYVVPIMLVAAVSVTVYFVVKYLKERSKKAPSIPLPAPAPSPEMPKATSFRDELIMEHNLEEDRQGNVRLDNWIIKTIPLDNGVTLYNMNFFDPAASHRSIPAPPPMISWPIPEQMLNLNQAISRLCRIFNRVDEGWFIRETPDTPYNYIRQYYRATPYTYKNERIYIGTDGKLYSGYSFIPVSYEQFNRSRFSSWRFLAEQKSPSATSSIYNKGLWTIGADDATGRICLYVPEGLSEAKVKKIEWDVFDIVDMHVNKAGDLHVHFADLKVKHFEKDVFYSPARSEREYNFAMAAASGTPSANAHVANAVSNVKMSGFSDEHELAAIYVGWRISQFGADPGSFDDVVRSCHDIWESEWGPLQDSLRRSIKRIYPLADEDQEGQMRHLAQAGEAPSADAAAAPAKAASRGKSGTLGNGPKEVGLPDPVRVIFAVHETMEAAHWTVGQVRLMLEGVEQHRPVVIWIEHGIPDGMPHTPVELEEDLRRLDAQHGTTLIEAFDYPGVLLQEPLPERFKRFLETIFNDFLRSQPSTESMLNEVVNPHLLAIRDGIDVLRREGWNIQIKAEVPLFDAYVDMLRWAIRGHVVLNYLITGQVEEALKTEELIFVFIDRSMRRRDMALASLIAEYHRSHPEAVSIVVRGRFHVDTFSESLHAENIGYRWIEQQLAWPGFRYMSAGLPPLESLQGRRILIENLLGHILYKFASDRNVDWSGLSCDVDSFVQSLPNNLLERWLNEIVAIGYNFTQLKAKTWDWLNENRQGMSGEGEALALYESVRCKVEQHDQPADAAAAPANTEGDRSSFASGTGLGLDQEQSLSVLALTSAASQPPAARADLSPEALAKGEGARRADANAAAEAWYNRKVEISIEELKAAIRKNHPKILESADAIEEATSGKVKAGDIKSLDLDSFVKALRYDKEVLADTDLSAEEFEQKMLKFYFYMDEGNNRVKGQYGYYDVAGARQVRAVIKRMFSKKEQAVILKDPVRYAAYVFVAIIKAQAFHDGNHRVADFVLNFILAKNGYKYFLLTPANILDYYRLLNTQALYSGDYDMGTITDFFRQQVSIASAASQPAQARADLSPEAIQGKSTGDANGEGAGREFWKDKVAVVVDTSEENARDVIEKLRKRGIVEGNVIPVAAPAEVLEKIKLSNPQGAEELRELIRKEAGDRKITLILINQAWASENSLQMLETNFMNIGLVRWSDILDDDAKWQETEECV